MAQFAHILRGDFDQVLALREQLVQKTELGFGIGSYERGICATSLTYSFLGRWDEAVKEAQEALSISEKTPANINTSYAGTMISVAYLLKGDLDRAIQYGEMATEKSLTFADRTWAQGILGWCWCRHNQLDKGIEALATAIESGRQGGHVPSLFWVGPGLAEGYLLAGENGKAKEMLDEVLKAAEDCGAKHFLGRAHRLLAELALKTKPEEAQPHFEKAISIYKEIKAENELALAYSGMGRHHKRQGNKVEARKYLTDALKIFERLGTLIEPDKVREELASL
jgi:tetratricopeptide (TPR) repeat protein